MKVFWRLEHHPDGLQGNLTGRCKELDGKIPWILPITKGIFFFSFWKWSLTVWLYYSLPAAFLEQICIYSFCNSYLLFLRFYCGKFPMLIIFTYVMRFTTDSKIIVLSAIREEVNSLVLLMPSQTEGLCLCMLFFFFLLLQLCVGDFLIKWLYC